MCHAIGCVCPGQTGHLQGVAASTDGRFGVSASVSSRNAVGSFIDRFRWPQPISHDWPTVLHIPLAFSSQDIQAVHRDRRCPEPHQNIKSSLAQRIALANTSTVFLTTTTTTTTTAMEFSGKDLEDIQRVAGLLNLTVDELLQQSRGHSENVTFDSSPPQHPQQGTGQPRWTDSLESRAPAFQHQQEPLELGLDTFDLDDLQSGGAGSDPSEMSLPPPATQSHGSVILLNPHTTTYDCDTAVWGINQSPGESLTFGDTAMDPDFAEDGSYVPVSEMEIDSESLSNRAAWEDARESRLDDGSSDWALVSASPASAASKTPKSPSSDSTDKRYHRIAPKYSKPSAQSSSESSSHRVKKRRSPYEGKKRIDTHLTRQLHACVRCRMQRNRVRCVVI